MSEAKKKRGGFVMWCIAALLLGVCAGVASKQLVRPAWAAKYSVAWSDEVGTKVADINYDEGEAQKFDLYLPADDARDAYGLVVYLHAGGFTMGDKSDDQSILAWLCSKGYVAAGVNYTLFSEEHPDASVYSQSVEVRDAMPAVVAKTEELGYHIDKMAVAGGSAGGCLALLYAYRDASIAPVPLRMVYEAVGPASMYREDWTNYGLDQSSEAAAELLSTMAGTKISVAEVESGAYLEKVRNVSAVDWVTEASVPTVMAYGAHDKMAPYLSSVRLDEALSASGVPHEYFVFPHSGHALQNDDAIYQRYMEAIDEYLATYLPIAE